MKNLWEWAYMLLSVGISLYLFSLAGEHLWPW